jgi:alkanesulfonate monooxygenase SsuD/methylene tetrahydromethanopterin reductase-like flavin-dependent oxidoreductase (luciferase family)
MGAWKWPSAVVAMCGILVGRTAEHQGRQLDEGIGILRRLWTESLVTHHREFYHFDDVTLEPKPRKGSLDIWIGGKSDAILERVVRLGDGWFPALTKSSGTFE